MLPWDADLAGRLERRTLDSTVLRGNPLGDPYQRPVWVYLPPGYDEVPGRFPAVYVIQGYTGHVAMWANRMPFRRPFLETADEVFATGAAPPVVVVYVDAWTAYGGSQFVDSPGTGRYHSYLCDEVVPWVDARYRTIPDRESRALCGKSSGGFGAMITPMLRPDVFGALATHAGDSLYELCYVPEFGDAARLLRDHDHDIWRWWGDFRSRPSFTRAGDATLLTVLGCSACFSAREDGGVDLPFDPRTGALVPDVWARWLAWDPVRMVNRYADAVRSLRAVWIDAGTRDEYYLDLGAQAFRSELTRTGLPDDRVFFELFDAAHGGIDYRYPMALTWLANRLARE
jgi:S-formylglutathione hydrolase FrmB